MDTIVQTLLREVALDGTQGSDLERLWEYVRVAQRETMDQLKLDSSDDLVDRSLKEYLWPIILGTRGLIFKDGDTVVYDTSAAPETQAIQKQFDKFSKLTLGQVESKYPGLIVRGSTAIINKEIYGSEQGIPRIISSACKVSTLQEIARAKQRGVTQRVVSKRLKLDNRSVFCYIRSLESEGLVCKIPTYEDGCNTNLLVLRRYQSIYSDVKVSDDPEQMVRIARSTEEPIDDNSGEGVPAPIDDNHPANVIASTMHSRFRKKICDYMQNLSASYIVDVDLIDAMGVDNFNGTWRRFFQRMVSRLCDDGYIECVRVLFPDPNQTTPTPPPGSNPDDLHDAGSKSSKAQPGEPDDPSELDDVEIGREQNMLPVKRRKLNRNDRLAPSGFMYRRCYRLLKPYASRSKVIASVGVPLQQLGRDDNQATENGSLTAVNDDEAGDSEELSDINSSSDEESPKVDDVKERADINHLLSMPQVKFGELACLSLDAQVFRLIALAGSHGTVARAIEVVVTNMPFRSISRIITRLETTSVFRPDGSIPGVYTSASQRKQNKRHLNEKLITFVEEFLGREHRKRYFVNPIAQPLIEYLTVDCSRNTNDPILPLAQLDANVQSGHSAVTASEGRVEGVSDRTENEDISMVSMSSDLAAGETAEQADKVAEELASIICEPASDEYGSIQEILADAEECKRSALHVLRERVIMRALEKESVFACTLRQVNRFEALVRQYILVNKDSHAIMKSIYDSAFKHKTDKTTYLRIIKKLAAQKRLWMQSVVPVIKKNSKNMAISLDIAIARSVDPKGPLVDKFVQSLHDERKYFVQKAPAVPRVINEPIAVPRTEGAEERDREYNSKARMRLSTQAKRAADALTAGLEDSVRVDKHMPKRAKVFKNDVRRKKVPTADAQEVPKDDSDPQVAWDHITKALDFLPRRTGRLVDLFEYMCENLPKQVDNKYVFENYGFTTMYLFKCIPLGLYMEITSGAMTIPEARYYIRYGSVPTHESIESETEQSEGNLRVQGTLDEMKARMATPIKDLPPELEMIIDDHLTRTRSHIRRLINGLYILQLIRPVANIKDIETLPPPPDAKDAFSNVEIENPRLLSPGYQIVGKARLLKAKGYLQTQELFELGSLKRFDLTQMYLNDEVFDLHQGTGLSQYMEALELSCRDQCYKLPVKHPLFGIASSYHWHRSFVLLPDQISTLESFIDVNTIKTPLNSLDELQHAADMAKATLDGARRYYKQRFTKLCSQANHKKRDKERLEEIRKHVDKVNKEKAQRKRQNTAEPGKPLRSKRIYWLDDESRSVAVYYAILKVHAREHKHIVSDQGIACVYPRRLESNNPTKSIKDHYKRMNATADYKSLCERLNVVWPYVLKDAVSEGTLANNPDIDQFNMAAAVDYFRKKLETESLDGLLETYADRMVGDKVFVPLGQTTHFNQKKRAKAAKAVPRRPRADEGKSSSKPADRRPPPLPRKVQVAYLPETMKGNEHCYVVEMEKYKGIHSTSLHDFSEDIYHEIIAIRKSKEPSKYTMLTTHCGRSSLSDYSSPATTILCDNNASNGADSMDVDGTSSRAQGTRIVNVVARAAESASYPDPLDSFCPISRMLDINRITEKISQLALGDVPDDIGIDSQANGVDGSRGTDSESNRQSENASKFTYADIASLQAMITNLTLTPDDEYDVGTGQMVLAAKNAAATQALALLSRYHIIYRLQGMASSMGLSSRDRNSSGSGSGGNAAESAKATVVDSEESTVVLHDTAGIARVDAPQDVASERRVLRSRTKEPLEPSGTRGRNDKERNVPGRGYAISSQFLGAIKSRLPSSFIRGQWALRGLDSSTLLDTHLDSGAFVYLCQQLGAGKLWLRPAYAPDARASFSGMAGFRRWSGIDLMHFDANIVEEDDSDLVNQGSDALSHTQDLQSIRDRAFSIIDLSADDHLALASRVVTDTIQLTGELGTTVYELAVLFTLLLDDKSSSNAMSLLPKSIRSVLGSKERLRALLRMLAIDSKLFVVGSADLRYVSPDAYHKYWSIRLDEPTGMTFVPFIGQSFNGSAITKYTLGMMTSIAGRILDNPGISQRTLMRRYYAPFVPKAEVVYYLDKLVALGVVAAETVEIDSAGSEEASARHLQPGDPGAITYYSMTEGYIARIPVLCSLDVATDFKRC
ncbi:hypothetical protein EV175_001182 [Coemansia sp. RSA 1933]|nr:hypothetical protein EV175_001182 [Coemansia sp. RSA 1933]